MADERWPVPEALTTLARPNTKIVEYVAPACLPGEGRIAGIKLGGFDLACQRAARVFKDRTRARQRRRCDALQVFRIDPDMLARTFERALQIGLLFQQTLVPDTDFIIHFGAMAEFG